VDNEVLNLAVILKHAMVQWLYSPLFAVFSSLPGRTAWRFVAEKQAKAVAPNVNGAG
jgi:hypothetical protein